MFLILLLYQLIILTIDVYAADPLAEVSSIEILPSEPPSLVTQCLHALKKLPPEQFQYWEDMNVEIKKKFIIEHGLTYVPKLFVASQAVESCPRIDGDVQANEPLRLCNNLIDIIISKQEPTAPEAPQDAQNTLPAYQLYSPEFSCACLQANKTYVGTQSGHVCEYKPEKRKLALITKQLLSQGPINYIISHPCIEGLIACRHPGGSIGIYKKNKQGSWVNQKNMNVRQPIEKMALCPSGKWLACANNHNVYIYDLASACAEVKHRLIHAANTVDALLFKDDQTMVMNSKNGTPNHRQLTVWRFRIEDHVSIYTIWGTPKIILDHHNEYYGLDKESEDNKWINHISSHILFRLTLDNIHSLKELALFKRHKDKLNCGEQPLFKLMAITNKTHELEKAEASRQHLTYMRK